MNRVWHTFSGIISRFVQQIILYFSVLFIPFYKITKHKTKNESTRALLYIGVDLGRKEVPAPLMFVFV